MRWLLSVTAFCLGTGCLSLASAADLDGRLFFSAERRAALDRARQFNIEEQQVSQQIVMTVEGLVKRSGGRSTAWVNGTAIPEQGLGGLNVTPDHRRSAVKVQAANEGATVVTVGTAINRTTGERVDPLGGGYVTSTASARKRP